MEYKIDIFYGAAINNETFIKAMKEADNDDIIPTSDDTRRTIIATMYYGWLVALHRENWKLHI